MSSLVGRTLGQYEIIEQIGQGGMATVFKAYQPGLDRFVALKILPPALAQQPDFTDRFVREAKAIARLNHPNILPVFDFGHIDGVSFLAMRYIDGAQTLRDVMNQRLTLKQMSDLIGQVAAALEYAHQQRIIHRDVKPANVLMDGEWALLSDFGLSKMMDSSLHLTGTGMSMGTPAYMSPEQGRGQKVDHRTDIYALGVILFEMLTGQIPHQADTPFGVLIKRLSEPLPPPRSLNSAIPEAVERVVVKALAFEPDERFERATEMAQALQAVVKETPAGGEMTLYSSKDTPLLAPTLPSPLPRQAASAPRQRLGRLFGGSQAEPQGERNRQAMLKLVRDFWIKGVLEQSLHGAARLELGLTEQAEAVEQPWEMVVQTPNVSALSIPSGTPISDVFTAMGETLLILGEPGSGKTTMLLELARQKLDEAAAEPGQPMPVVFNLSSWQSGQSLAEWLVDELRTKYNIPKKIAQPWVENEELLLLLDGLDEVAVERRENCVEAINEFRQEHLVPLVVCSRVADYELLTTKLKLQGAVLIQPLVHRQVEVYLAQAGPELSALRELLRTDETLQELTRSPLLLSVMALAYRGKSAEELSQFKSVEARRQHLFETYTEQMFQRRGVDTRYSPTDTKQWLSWIAQKMQEHSQSIFLIERLQPKWLKSWGQKWLYVLLNGVSVALISAVTVGFVWLVFSLAFNVISGENRVMTILFLVLFNSILGIIFGLVGGILGSFKLKIEPFEKITWSGSAAKKGALQGFGGGSIFTLGMTYLAGGSNIVALVVFGIFGMMFAVIATITTGMRRTEISMSMAPNQGIKQSLKNAILLGLLMTAITGLFLGAIPSAMMFAGSIEDWGLRAFLIDAVEDIGLVLRWIFLSLGAGLLIALVDGLLLGLFFGGFAVIKHFTLRLILWRKGYLPWNLARFLDYAAERIFLRKVGGGYIFVHRLLLEHFASLEQ